MSRKYKFHNPEGAYFVSFAVVNWIDVFTRNEYKNILVEKTQVIIYEGSINESTKKGKTSYIRNKLTQDQKIAATGNHETHHATDQADINIRRTKGVGQLGAQHQNARDKGTLSALEFGTLNKNSAKKAKQVKKINQNGK